MMMNNVGLEATYLRFYPSSEAPIKCACTEAPDGARVQRQVDGRKLPAPSKHAVGQARGQGAAVIYDEVRRRDPQYTYRQGKFHRWNAPFVLECDNFYGCQLSYMIAHFLRERKSMPRLQIVARHYWPHPGAASDRLTRLAEEAAARRWDVEVITRRTDDTQAESPLIGPSGELVHLVPGDHTTGVGIKRMLDLIKFSVGAARMVRRRPRPDVVVVDPPPPILLAISRIAAAPVAYYFADSWAELTASSKGRLSVILGRAVARLERRACERATATLGVTPYLTELALSNGAKEAKLFWNGVDARVFRSDGPTWHDPWSGQLPYFVYAGNAGEAHGAFVFAEAAVSLWDEGERFGLVFMGYGSDLAKAERLMCNYPDLGLIITPQPPEVAASAFRGSTAALASLRPVPSNEHTILVKVLAASSTGAPMIYAGGGDLAGLIKEANLGVVAPLESVQIAKSMQSVLREPWSDIKRADLGRRALSRFDAAHTTSALMGYLTDLSVRRAP
jgi:glycosyltransferase involved in cell wall biosynthesis